MVFAVENRNRFLLCNNTVLGGLRCDT